jgi:hypothetical protein
VHGFDSATSDKGALKKKKKEKQHCRGGQDNKEDDALSRRQGKMLAGKNFDAAFVSQTSALS